MFRAVKIRHYLAAMRTRGFSAEEVLAGTKIEAGKLRDPAYLIDFPQCREVVANMIRLTGNQGIGFEIGNEAEFIDLGIVGHALLSCRDARSAVLLWTRYSNSLVGMLVELKLEESSASNWSITITESAPMGFLYNFCVEEILVIMVKLGSALTDQRAVIQRLELSYPAPAHQALYAQYLNCTPHFNAPSSRMTCSSPSLDRTLRGSDEEFNAICLQHCSQIMRQIASSDIVARLRNLLLSRRGSVPGLDEAAAQLGMSTRTLRRRLSEEGLSYHGLVDGFRFDLAREYLGSSHISAKEVSYLLGFSDVDVFRRAFKKWSGKTVGEYQKRIA